MRTAELTISNRNSDLDRDMVYAFLRKKPRGRSACRAKPSSGPSRARCVSAAIIAGVAIGLMILRMGYMSGRDAVTQLLGGRGGGDAGETVHAARTPASASQAVE